MDSPQTSTENVDPKPDENGVDMAKLEAMVTPEQVLSATVAKKRRTITRKRSTSTSMVRSQTPIRVAGVATSSSDETNELHPKTPERKNKKTRAVSTTTTTKTEETNTNEPSANTPLITEPPQQPIMLPSQTIIPPPEQINPPDSTSASEIQSIISDTNERRSSLPRQLEEQMLKLDTFVTSNTKDFINLLQKAKTSVEEKGKELRRRKFHRTDQKRSQSTPKQLTETDLLESFRIAQEATAERARAASEKRYSSSPEPQRPARKPVKPLVQQYLKQKKAKSTIKSNKIIEILDPKTAKIIAVRDVGAVARMGLLDALKILRYFSVIEIMKEWRKYKRDMGDEYSRIRQQRRRCISHLLILMIFCGLGGMIFKFTEGSFENFYKCGVKRVKRDFIDLLWVRSHNMREDEWKSLARNRLRSFEDELHAAHEAGVHSYSGQRSWSFLNGIVYCLTVVTTIGYGHLYPTTKTGQALTIVYSLIGIPLFLIILTDFGKLFTRCIKFLWSFVRRLYYTGSCRSVRKTAHVQEIFKGAQMMYEMATFRRPSMFDPKMAGSPESNETANTTAPPTPAISNFEIDDEFNLPISVAILLLVLYILLGALLFGIWEGWDFFSAFYFVFISMSTIGFGDYVPRHPIFMIVSIVYLVFGLALMSMCINVVQVKLSDTFKQASAKIGATIGLGVAEEDGVIEPVPPKGVEMPPVHGSTSEINSQKSPSPNATTLKPPEIIVKE